MITIEAVAPLSNEAAIIRIAKQCEATDHWVSSRSDHQIAIKILVEKSKSQKMLDALQDFMSGKSNFRVISYPLEVALPFGNRQPSTLTREALVNRLSVQSQVDGHYLMLVFLSTVVAAIGLIENNVAVIIGAMVIAPLLSPNLSLSLAITLGKIPAIFNAIKTLVIGILLAMGISVAITWLYPQIIMTQELLARTHVGLDGLVLALASGAAAALSITTGVSSVLVGVMVAVALLPPTVTLGITLGINELNHALGAALLLVANIASVNLAAQITMRVKNIRPRDATEHRMATFIFAISAILWVLLLGLIIQKVW